MKIDISINKVKKVLQFLYSMIFTFIIANMVTINSFASTASADPNLETAVTNFLDTYSFYFNVFLGFVIFTNILIFIYHFIQLGAYSTNPQQRAKILNNMLITGICLGIIGGGSVVIFLLFHFGYVDFNSLFV